MKLNKKAANNSEVITIGQMNEDFLMNQLHYKYFEGDIIGYETTWSNGKVSDNCIYENEYEYHYIPRTLSWSASGPRAWWLTRCLPTSAAARGGAWPGPWRRYSAAPASGHQITSAAASCRRLIGEVVQSRRRPLLGPSPG